MSADNWRQANQDYLAAHLARIRLVLEQHALDGHAGRTSEPAVVAHR